MPYKGLKFKDIFLNVILSLILFFILSLFISFKKIYIVLIISIGFFFFKKKYKKIILFNLISIAVLLKIIFIFNNSTDYYTILSKTIYEKHFLVGVKNLNLNTSIYGGNMDPNNKKNIRTINIKTDSFGYRNSTHIDEAEYILIGDSLFHSHRIDQSNLINERLNIKNNKNFYNASMTGTDIGHYFETIKFFKKINKNAKFIMIIFPGNDFLNYELIQKNYSEKLGNNFLKNYFEIKEYFDFYTKIKFMINILKKKEKLEGNIDKTNIINGKKILFFKDYYVKPNRQIRFSNEFDIYKDNDPDLLIIVPSKAQVYCKLLINYDCANINYVKILKNISLFNNSKIIDSTDFLRDKAKEKLISNEFIYFEDDTHLNELGLDIFSDFILDNLN
jgi:energy-coupling factor transporter transmembrane protein EcfT